MGNGAGSANMAFYHTNFISLKYFSHEFKFIMTLSCYYQKPVCMEPLGADPDKDEGVVSREDMGTSL